MEIKHFNKEIDSRLLLYITLGCFLVYLSISVWQVGASLTLEGDNTGQNCCLLQQPREGSPLAVLVAIPLGDTGIPIAFREARMSS